MNFSSILKLALELEINKEINGQSFNFGPSNESNFTVESLVNEMAKNWKNSKWKSIGKKNKLIKESKLLKLNCDKAFFYLNWRPRLSFNETTTKTVEWYKEYYKKNIDNLENLTSKQILEYFKK